MGRMGRVGLPAAGKRARGFAGVCRLPVQPSCGGGVGEGAFRAAGCVACVADGDVLRAAACRAEGRYSQNSFVRPTRDCVPVFW